MKYNNFKRYILSNFFKSIDFRRYNFLKKINSINYQILNVLKKSNNINFKVFNLKMINIVFFKFLKITNSSSTKFLKTINIKKYKYLPFYFLVFIIISLLIYISIPKFYNYNDLQLTNKVCNNYKLICLSAENPQYTIFPTPRILIKNVKIYESNNSKILLADIKKTELILPLKNLLKKQNVSFKKIKLNRGKFNLNLKKIKTYKKFLTKLDKLIPVKISQGQINFFDGKKNIMSIQNITLKHNPGSKKNKTTLEGNFLSDNLYMSLLSKKNESTIFLLKMKKSNFYSKIELLNNEENKGLLKLGKNRFTSIFNYNDNEINIKHANITNDFLDGKLSGVINFSPYFDFNLNLDLNSLNFNSLYNVFIKLNETNKENFYQINNKINGRLNLFVNKIRSKYNLVKSLESRLIFKNSNILIDQLLLNFGKMGAADIIGIVKTDGKNKNFNFETNVFVDNKKYFYSKFGIYDKQKVPTSIFASGSFNLINKSMHLKDIFSDHEFENEDINIIEKNFNSVLTADGYESLFSFPNLKNFVKSIAGETN